MFNSASVCLDMNSNLIYPNSTTVNVHLCLAELDHINLALARLESVVLKQPSNKQPLGQLLHLYSLWLMGGAALAQLSSVELGQLNPISFWARLPQKGQMRSEELLNIYFMTNSLKNLQKTASRLGLLLGKFQGQKLIRIKYQLIFKITTK